MRILVAVDENPYSLYAIGWAARFAANTWPDITLLAVEDPKTSQRTEGDESLEESHPKIQSLRNYRADFLHFLEPGLDIYSPRPDPEGFQVAGKNLLQERSSGGQKNLLLRLRSERPTKAILTESKELQSDLIILGSCQGAGEWEGVTEVPGKVADGADCSVLVVRDDKRPAKVACCLNHDDVSQESLEIINQLVTQYGADLEIVGILRQGELKEAVERKMGDVLNYYLQRGVRALLKVVEEREMESFISTGAQTDLMALWLSPKSTFQRIFSGTHFTSLINNSLASMLILR